MNLFYKPNKVKLTDTITLPTGVICEQYSNGTVVTYFRTEIVNKPIRKENLLSRWVNKIWMIS